MDRPDLVRLVERFAQNSYEEVVDVGAAEGYYAIGCARLFKSVIVRTFHTSQLSHVILHRNAELNDVANRVVIGRLCSASTLTNIALGKRILAIVDCEGARSMCWTSPARPSRCGVRNYILRKGFTAVAPLERFAAVNNYIYDPSEKPEDRLGLIHFAGGVGNATPEVERMRSYLALLRAP